MKSLPRLIFGMGCCLLSCSTIWSQTTIFEDDFEQGILDPAFWEANADENLRGEDSLVEVALSAQGVPVARNSSYGVVFGGKRDGYEAINTLDLYLDLSGFSDVAMSFWIKDQEETTQAEEGIWFSDDGGSTFKKVYDFQLEDWRDDWGQLPPIDVDRLARARGLRLTSRFVIRFRNHSFADFINSNCCDDKDGMFLDDVRVYSPETTYATVPFSEDFEAGRFSKHWTWAEPYLTAERPEIRPAGMVGVISEFEGLELALNGFYSAVLGKRSTGTPATNCMDLHVDLSGQEQLALQLNVRGIDEKADAEDGIWLSDDGGKSFVKAYAFSFDSWDTESGFIPPIDLDRLFKAKGLQMTNRCVIRFQQHGSGDPRRSNCCEEYDGLVVDDITITSPPRAYVQPPFSDSFETNRLERWWQWATPVETAPPETLMPSGVLGVFTEFQGQNIARTGFYGLVMSKEFDYYGTTNSADLFLNLAEFVQADLRFWVFPVAGAIQGLDGIFLSEDDGFHFTKIYDFAGLEADTWQEVHLDLDEEARLRNLSFSNKMVLRFQQYGSKDSIKTNCCDSKDGFFFDDITLTGQKSPQGRQLTAIAPWIVDNAGFTSEVAIYNDETFPANLLLEAIDRDGNRNTAEVVLPGRSLYAISSHELFPGLSGYSLFVHANVASLITSFLTVNKEPISGGHSPSLTLGSNAVAMTSRLVFGYVPGNQTSAIVLVAPRMDQGQSQVTLTLHDKTGETLASKEILLHERRPYAVLAHELFDQIPDDASIRAVSTDGISLAGTTFIFNHQRQPSMAAAVPVTN